MRSLMLSVCLILFCIPAAGLAQQEPTEKLLGQVPSTWQSIELGLSRKEVRERWGNPNKHYSPKLRGYFVPQEQEAAERLLGLLDDVYYRNTAANKYEVRFRYERDTSKSRLQPFVFANTIELIVDKPVAALETLRDIPEVLDLCRSSCGLYADLHDTHVVAYPKNLSPSEIEKGFQLVRTWSKEIWKTGGFVPAVFLGWEDETRESLSWRVIRDQDVDWLNQPIEQISFGFVFPRLAFELKGDKKNALGHKVVSLGIFNP